MGVVFLLHHTGTGASAQPQAMCNMYGYTLLRIDLLGNMPKGGHRFDDLDEALADPRFKDWTWIFFDPRAGDPLNKFVHQKDNTIYVYGDDVDGWGRSLDQLPGALVRIDASPEAPELHTASECAVSTIIHRYYQVDA